MPSDRFLKAMNAVHRAVVRVSGGRVGYSAGAMPVLELTTIGRRSGEPRSVLLTAPVAEGDTFVVVASRGGDDRHPAWFLNLQADPTVQVSVQGAPPRPMRAEVVGPGERPALWSEIAGRYRNYAGYQKRTEREIPLVRLTPA
ncbi:nitroreductase/quinone reductase family protein [Pseudonocardia sp. WMMC193]|uniref:nitroreductase/quinone reductase family protein n=1 Tax=Pseudonocardia sp. WMMC193 TaxID=2911965 RepID=UPI001F2E312D|nr:nitroreductase/quinone reductase family protein [Pseudonocardia sp. WMMC193]MCF7547731.1 nitroreductase family deazaflavin-dependent oxidoreductase [Pseudonocardia sp. WMMC193]